MYLLLGSCLFWRNKFTKDSFDVQSEDYGFDFLVSFTYFCLEGFWVLFGSITENENPIYVMGH
jgi:hypothetical protein